MTTTIGIGELRQIFISCTGAEQATGHPDGTAFADTSFQDLGYDSLVLLEVTARIQQEHGISVADDDVFDASTPGALLDAVHAAAAVAD